MSGASGLLAPAMARRYVSPCNYGLYVDLLVDYGNDRVSLEVLVGASLAG